MASIYRNHKIILVAAALLAMVFILSRCIASSGADNMDLRGPQFAGAEKCQGCHQEVYAQFLQTAHHLTSRPVSDSSVKGSFDPGKNVFEFNAHWKVVMQKNSGHFYQTAYEDGKESISKPFDIVVGSGRKAQTYLYYNDSSVYQLPVSYFVAENSWANSPNFPAGHPKFDRSIPSGCFTCHSSAVKVNQTYAGFQLKEAFEKGKIIYGIDCERCHGPGMNHIQYHQEHPGEKQGKQIARISSMNRLQKNDMCAMCHSGFREMQRSTFQFRPGDSLSNFFYPDLSPLDADQLDVHGKQDQLMKASKCYLQGNSLTCGSCHDPHIKERDNLEVFSQRCISCHKETIHSFAVNNEKLIKAVASNCIDCHMPLQPSSRIMLLTRQNTNAKPDLIRTHWIKIYPAEAEKILGYLKEH